MSMDTYVELEVKVRPYGGSYIARTGRFQASCTSDAGSAMRTAAAKALNAEPKIQFRVEPKDILLLNVSATGATARLYPGMKCEVAK